MKKLAEKVSKTPYSLMSPVKDQAGAIMLSAWGKQVTVDGADDERVNQFFTKYVQGPQTPSRVRRAPAAWRGWTSEPLTGPHDRSGGRRRPARAGLRRMGAVTALGREGGDASGSAAATPSDTSADAGFARDMAVHHQQAVEMSFVVRDRTQDEEVRRLAYDIANTQANQRGMMLGWLDLWGLPKTVADREPMSWMEHGKGGAAHGGGHGGSHGGSAEASTGSGDDQPIMAGMATRAEMQRLGTLSGKESRGVLPPADDRPPRGRVHMAQGCVDACAVPVQKALAQGMVDVQESEIGLMTDMLRSGAPSRAAERVPLVPSRAPDGAAAPGPGAEAAARHHGWRPRTCGGRCGRREWRNSGTTT